MPCVMVGQRIYLVVVFGHKMLGFRFLPLLSHKIMVSALTGLGCWVAVCCVAVVSSGIVVVFSDVLGMVFEMSVSGGCVSVRVSKRFAVGMVQFGIASVGGVDSILSCGVFLSIGGFFIGTFLLSFFSFFSSLCKCLIFSSVFKCFRSR